MRWVARVAAVAVVGLVAAVGAVASPSHAHQCEIWGTPCYHYMPVTGGYPYPEYAARVERVETRLSAGRWEFRQWSSACNYTGRSGGWNPTVGYVEVIGEAVVNGARTGVRTRGAETLERLASGSCRNTKWSFWTPVSGWDGTGLTVAQYGTMLEFYGTHTGP